MALATREVALANESLRTGLATLELGPELEVELVPALGKVTLAPRVARSEACNVLGAVGADDPVVEVRGRGLGLTALALATGWFPSFGAAGNGTLRRAVPLVVNSSAGAGVGLGGRRAAGGGEPGEPFESIVALRERTEGDITAACGTCGDPLTLP